MYILPCTHAQSSKKHMYIHKKCSLSMLQPTYSLSSLDRINCTVRTCTLYNVQEMNMYIVYTTVCLSKLTWSSYPFPNVSPNTWVRVRPSHVHTYRVSRVVTVQMILQFGYGPLWRGAAHSEVVHGSVGRLDDHMYHSPRPAPLYTRIIAKSQFHFLLFMIRVSTPRD